MGVSKMTGMMIQNWPDVDGPSADGLYLEATGEGETWAGYLYLCKNGAIHQLVLSTAPVFPTEEAAKVSIRDVMIDIRKMPPLEIV